MNTYHSAAGLSIQNRLHRRAVVVALLTLLVLSLAACGSTDEEKVSSSPLEAPSAAEASQQATGSATPMATATPEMGSHSESPLGGIQRAGDLLPEQRDGMYDTPPAMMIDPDKYYYATIKTEKGDIKVQLFADRAPETVNNFVFLAREGFYDDLTFHRVLDGFMAQAGDPAGTGAGGPGYVFEDEIFPGLVFDQSGLLAMANRGPVTNGSQWFITFSPTEWLNGAHTIFGKVLEGDDVLAQITRNDPSGQAETTGDIIHTILIEESDSSVLPTPSPPPPTPTPTATPTPFAPSSVDSEDRPLAAIPPVERVNYFNTPPEMVIDTDSQYTATISTNKGDIIVTLYDDIVPVAVNNFVVLANLGFYDNTPIASVQPEDSIVFGVPDNNPLNDAGYKFAAEVGAPIDADVGALTYIPFSESAEGDILSSSSQVLVALIKPPAELNARFSFFGQVNGGDEVLSQLTTDDTIESIVITVAE